MNVTIVGPGAMGCLFAFLLIRSHINVWILDYKKERAEFVEPNLKSNKKFKVIRTDLLDDIHLARHNPEKLARAIMKL